MSDERKEVCNIQDCIEMVNERLAEKIPNAELSATLQFTNKGATLTVLQPLAKIDKRIRGKIPNGIAPAFCPFCGGKATLEEQSK